METFESTFPANFRKEDVAQIIRFVLVGKFCQLVCIPGGGKSTLLRLLANNSNLRRFHLGEKEESARFIYLNLLELTKLDQPTINELLLHSLDPKAEHSNDPIILAKQLNEIASRLTVQKGTTLILLFDHFDEFQNKLSRSFFQNLRSLKNLAKYKFSCVFATRRNLQELVDSEILKEFYDFFIGNALYMKLDDQKATSFLLSKIEQALAKQLSPDQKKRIVSLTSGHAKLTKVITESVLQENLTLDPKVLLKNPLVTAALFELWLFLTAQEQKTLLDVISHKPVNETDALENLVQCDLLKNPQQPILSEVEGFNNETIEPALPAGRQSNNLLFTIPLFEEFVRTTVPTFAVKNISYNPNTREITKGEIIISDLLSPQENRLLRFLIENQGRIVEREEIIQAVWPQVQIAEGISDEAIDQMVFRLRKKIEDEPNNPKHLTTIKGRGLRFAP